MSSDSSFEKVEQIKMREDEEDDFVIVDGTEMCRSEAAGTSGGSTIRTRQELRDELEKELARLEEEYRSLYKHMKECLAKYEDAKGAASPGRKEAFEEWLKATKEHCQNVIEKVSVQLKIDKMKAEDESAAEEARRVANAKLDEELLEARQRYIEEAYRRAAKKNGKSGRSK